VRTSGGQFSAVTGSMPSDAGGATHSARMVSLVIPAGTAYGLAVFVVASFFGLPIVAKLTASGPTITKMTKVVGWSGGRVSQWSTSWLEPSRACSGSH